MKSSSEFTVESLKHAFPEIHEEIRRAGFDAGVAEGLRRGREEGRSAGRMEMIKEAEAKKPKVPTPEEKERIEAALPLEERAQKRWLRDPELRAQHRMGGYPGFLALLKHEERMGRAQ